MNTVWHFPVMICASLIVFLGMIRIIIGRQNFKDKIQIVLILALVVVVLGMLMGKYGSQLGLKWWIYYPIPMFMTVILPPVLLKMNAKKTMAYLILSFLSAPLIHLIFSFVFGWNEYLPFWDIPYYKELI